MIFFLHIGHKPFKRLAHLSQKFLEKYSYLLMFLFLIYKQIHDIYKKRERGIYFYLINYRTFLHSTLCKRNYKFAENLDTDDIKFIYLFIFIYFYG